MAETLPDDILIEIFRRLPVKSLIRFKCVTKSWMVLISDAKLIDQHLDFHIKNHKSERFHIFAKTQSNPTAGMNRRSFVLCDEAMKEKTVLHFPFKSLSDGYFKIIGACNGILCLIDTQWGHYGRVVYLWNPSIRRIKILRDSVVAHSVPPNCAPKLALGFGFDKLNSDFKIVRIFYFAENNPVVEVYSLSKDSWHRLEAKFPRVASLSTSYAYLNGVVYWYSKGKSVIGLNLGSEEITEIALPYCCLNSTVNNIFVCKGKLTLLNLVGQVDKDELKGYFAVWMVTEYESWTRTFFMDTRDLRNVNINMETLSNSGWKYEDVMEGSNRVIAYRPGVDEFREVRGYVIPPHIVRYTESLVLLDKGRDVSEYFNSFRGVTNNGIELVIEEETLRPVKGVTYDGINILIKDNEDESNNRHAG